ncbi:hypothetical protein NQZ68_008829 [Dissostichus eleginoides]|nr:hypothetical protein NQZ68_008829 [Dissostichus eleginoides]
MEEREGGREGETASRSSRFGSFGSGDAQDATKCPGSHRWFTAARRREQPSTAARKSAQRRRRHSDRSKPHLRFNNFHITSRETPGKPSGAFPPLYPPTTASIRPRTARRTADLTWT